MKVELGEHWEHVKLSNKYVLRLNTPAGTPGITINCRDKTFLFRRITLDEFGASLRIESFRPWPTGLRHKKRLRGLKNYLIAQYKLEES